MHFTKAKQNRTFIQNVPFPKRGRSGNLKPVRMRIRLADTSGCLLSRHTGNVLITHFRKFYVKNTTTRKRKKKKTHLHQRPRNNCRRRMNMLQRIVANAHVCVSLFLMRAKINFLIFSPPVLSICTANNNICLRILL